LPRTSSSLKFTRKLRAGRNVRRLPCHQKSQESTARYQDGASPLAGSSQSLRALWDAAGNRACHRCYGGNQGTKAAAELLRRLRRKSTSWQRRQASMGSLRWDKSPVVRQVCRASISPKPYWMSVILTFSNPSWRPSASEICIVRVRSANGQIHVIFGHPKRTWVSFVIMPHSKRQGQQKA